MSDVVMWLGIVAAAWAIVAGIFAWGWMRFFRQQREMDERDAYTRRQRGY